MPDLIRSLDVLILPSVTTPKWKEQFGRVLIEGMACGVPVVGSTSGEIPRVIGDAGIVVPEGDIDALAAAMRKLYDDGELRAQLSSRGRRRVLNQFTHTRIAEKTFDAYAEALARK
jgi:glycosyltransferase involved in cell wall biosynthesis